MSQMAYVILSRLHQVWGEHRIRGSVSVELVRKDFPVLELSPQVIAFTVPGYQPYLRDLTVAQISEDINLGWPELDLYSEVSAHDP